MAGAFDGTGQGPLMARAGAGLPSWADLAIFGHEAAQHVGVFVIDGNVLICAKLANFWARYKAALP